MPDCITGIPCPECNHPIYFENLCDCEEPSDCYIEHHEYFFCIKCQEQKDVSWEDEINIYRIEKYGEEEIGEKETSNKSCITEV